MNVAVLDLAEAEAEAAYVNVIAVDLVSRNVAVLGEDEQGCGVELDALFQASCSLHRSVHPKEDSEVGVVELAECSMGGWLKHDSSKLEKHALYLLIH
jgi:hypothetical protein